MATIQGFADSDTVTYRKTSTVAADLDTVWEFYDDVDELRILTPDWFGLRIPRVVGPDGEPGQHRYLVGTTVHIELQPFGWNWLPETEMVVEITDRKVGERERYFVDELVEEGGPYQHWRHEHRFVDEGTETRIADEISYRVAGGLPLVTPLLAGILWHRHRKTRTLLTD